MQSLRATYEAHPSSVPRSRRAVQQALAAWGRDELGWSAALLTSELVSNALLHARTPFTVVLSELPDGGARLEVSDGSRRLPRSRRYGDDATTGRGLHLLSELAQEWGAQVTASGKTVWAVLTPAVAGEEAADAGPADLDGLLLSFPDTDDTSGHAAGSPPARTA